MRHEWLECCRVAFHLKTPRPVILTRPAPLSSTRLTMQVDFAQAGLHDPTLVRLDVDTKLSEQLRCVMPTNEHSVEGGTAVKAVACFQ
jgi:hypothetical protein